ncbi:MAG: germination protein YpeB [Eubacterium sp.]|nr:germination protein YpeB [Eubacterium sp.]
MTRRTYIRIISFISFLLFILIATVMINTRLMNEYRNKLEISYQQSLSELGENLNNVNTDLTKSLYSNSDGEIYDISRDLFASCSVAKNALSRLPVSQLELANTYKFLSQAGDYAQYIASRIEEGKTVGEKEHKNLKTLLDYSEEICSSCEKMVRISQAGASILQGEVKSGENLPVSALSNSFSNSAKTFEDFPTLLYDGPFSEQVLNKKSKFISDSKVISREQAKQIAADALGANPSSVSFEGDDKSNIPCYTFNCARYNISVTKQGGYIKSIIYSGLIKSSGISEDNAVNIAGEFLKSIGYKNMAESYFSTENNICTISFIYSKNGVYYYPDMIKCSVSMNDGKIVALDAQTYLTNHIQREKFSAILSEKEAAAKVSPYLDINSVKKCVIPKENGKEKECFEFSCTSTQTGEDALIYINSQTGREEDIMILLHTDGGTLVK